MRERRFPAVALTAALSKASSILAAVPLTVMLLLLSAAFPARAQEPEAQALIRELVLKLKSSKPEVRLEAIRGIARLGPEAREAVPALLEAFGDRDFKVRAAAAEALGQMGPEAREAVSALLELLVGKQRRPSGEPPRARDFDPGALEEKLRSRLVSISEEIEGLVSQVKDLNASMQTLIESLPSADRSISYSMLADLWKLRGQIDEKMQEMRRLIDTAQKERFPELRARFDEWFRTVDRFVSDVQNMFVDGLSSGNVQVCQDSIVRRASALALGSIACDPDRVIPALVRAFKDQDPDLRNTIIEALKKFGSAAAPVLVSGFERMDTDGRCRILHLLVGIRADPGLIIPLLLKSLKKGSPELWLAASYAIKELGPDAALVVPSLLERAGRENTDTDEFLAAVLGKIGEPAVPALIAALKREERGARLCALMALDRIGPEASAAAPALIATLKDADPRTRLYAVLALESVGPVSEAAVQALIGALRDEDPDVRDVAVEAVRNLDGAPLPAGLSR